MGVRDLLPSRRIVNLFGAVAYSLLLLVYTAVAMITIRWLLTGGQSVMVLVEDPNAIVQEELPTPDRTTAGVIGEIVAYIIMSFMGLTVLFVAITLPYWLGRMGSYVLKRLIRWCKWRVTSLSLLIGKIIACSGIVAPLLLFIAQDITSLFSLLTVASIAGVALVLFCLQHYLAKMMSLQSADIW